MRVSVHNLSSFSRAAYCELNLDRQSLIGKVLVVMRCKLFETMPPVCRVLPHPDTCTVTLPLMMFGLNGIDWTFPVSAILVAVWISEMLRKITNQSMRSPIRLRNLLVGQGQPIERRMSPDLVTSVNNSAGVEIDGSNDDVDCVAELSICAGRGCEDESVV